MENRSPADFIAKIEAPSWFSGTMFMERDIHFILKLLSAPVYKSLPNLYERLVMYKAQTEALLERLLNLQIAILKFKNNLEHYPEDDGPSIDEYYYGRWKHFKDQYIVLDSDFLKAKYEIFGYLEAAMVTTIQKTTNNEN